jgi:peptidoglycan/xylan/chitin deacetylase (PgdA/CDA1 family)
MDTERTRPPLVLMYHSVEPYETDPYQVTVHPQRFDQQLRWLRRRGLRGVSMRTLLAERAPGMVGLTFDDGYLDFVTEVMPALARYGFSATVFVVAGALGSHNTWDHPGPRKQLMTVADVHEAAAADIEIGSHGLHHVHLSELAKPALAEHVRRSRTILSEISGQDVTGFCYPYGDAAEREEVTVRAAGYDYACATKQTAITGRYALPRAFIGDRDSPPRLLAKVVRHRLTAGRAA